MSELSDNNQTYLGDGVYAEFDGYQVNLRVNHHRNPVAVSLDPDTMQSLVRFARTKGQQIK